MDRTEVTVVGYFNGKSDLFDEYVVAANEMRGTFKFMHTFDPEVAKSFDVPQESVVVYIPEVFWTEYENKTYTLNKKSATYKEIINFIRTNSVPLVGWRNKRNEFKYHERPLVVMYYDGKWVLFHFEFSRRKFELRIWKEKLDFPAKNNIQIWKIFEFEFQKMTKLWIIALKW